MRRAIACWISLCVLGSIASAQDVDQSPLPVELVPAFENVSWANWAPTTDEGLAYPFRPILLTHAGDGSKRVFVPQQQGRIHVIAGHHDAQTSQVFLDISAKVRYIDKENEEGLLGLAFHPKYRENRFFYVYYATNSAPHTLVLSQFQTKADDPNSADPANEVELLRLPSKMFWNHNGGTIVFGPDGYLYVAIGDGGSRDDPHKNGQNPKTLFGKILRIDVDSADKARKYGIPNDNPFAGKPDAGAGEVFAWGFRNPWRIAFDRKTGDLWAADVGQDLWEEINIVRKGGNYGWNVRESLHPFPPSSTAPKSPDVIDPIWEYDHKVGKSITGGNVYRGKGVPALEGHYVYADYVSGKLWGLKYDRDAKRVVANRPIEASAPMLVISFGEDEAGEAYVLTVTPNGKGVYRFASKR